MAQTKEAPTTAAAQVLAEIADPDPVTASASWALTAERVVKKPAGLDLSETLDVIEAQMRDAPELHLAVRTHLDRGDGAAAAFIASYES